MNDTSNLTECVDPSAAVRRAGDLIVTAAAGADRAYWDEQGRRVLAALMHAAALGDRGMGDVVEWVENPDAHRVDILQLLRRSPAYSVRAAGEQFIGANLRTRSSIAVCITTALAGAELASA